MQQTSIFGPIDHRLEVFNSLLMMTLYYLRLRILASYKTKKNQQPVDILAYNSANKPSFQDMTKNLFAQRSIDEKSTVTF